MIEWDLSRSFVLLISLSFVPLVGCLENVKEESLDNDTLPTWDSEIKNITLIPKTLKKQPFPGRNLSYLQEDDNLSIKLKGGCFVPPPPIVLSNFTSSEFDNLCGEKVKIENVTLQVKYRTVHINSSHSSWLNHVNIVRDGIPVNTTILPMDHEVEDIDECVLEGYSNKSTLDDLVIMFEWPHRWGQGLSRYYFDYFWVIVAYREAL